VVRVGEIADQRLPRTAGGVQHLVSKTDTAGATQQARAFTVRATRENDEDEEERTR
jgi:hypothetical protein